MQKSMLVVLLAGMFMASAASAQDFLAKDSSTGFKGGMTFTWGNASVTSTGTLDKSMTYGANFIGGYNINQYAAIEISLGAAMGPKSGTVDLTSNATTVDAVGYYPLEEGLHAYGFIGYGKTGWSASNSQSKSKNAPRWGGGVELGRTGENSPAVMRFGFETYDNGDLRVTQVVFGPIWKF